MTKNRVLLQCLLASILMQGLSVAWAGDIAEYPPPQFTGHTPLWQAVDNPPETRQWADAEPLGSSDLEATGAVHIEGTPTEKQYLWIINTKEKIDSEKRSVTSSLSSKSRFQLNSKYIEKLPYWRDGNRFSPDAELGADMQLSLFDGLKVSGLFSSRMPNQDSSNPQVFDTGNINSWMQAQEAGPFGSLDTEQNINFVDTGKHFIKLDATGKQGAFGYGIRYLSRSKGYKSPSKKTRGINEDLWPALSSFMPLVFLLGLL